MARWTRSCCTSLENGGAAMVKVSDDPLREHHGLAMSFDSDHCSSQRTALIEWSCNRPAVNKQVKQHPRRIGLLNDH